MLLNQQNLDINLYYEEKQREGFTQIIVLEDKEAIKKIAEQEEAIKAKKESGAALGPDDKVTVKVLKTIWKVISWGQQNKMSSQCERYTPQGTQDLDWIKYRDARLKNCLVGWDIKNEQGQDIPCVPQHIEQLPSHVAAALLNRYDKITLGDETTAAEEEEKN